MYTLSLKSNIGFSAILASLFLSTASFPLHATEPSMHPQQSGSIQIAAESGLKKEAAGFVNSVARRGIGFLSDTNLTQDQRRQAFRNLLRDSFDLATIGRFALGKYWRVATPQQRQEYMSLFEGMVIQVYSERFEAYDGQQLQVVGSREASATDAIVSSLVVPKAGGEKVKVDWRVRQVAGRYRVVDVIVEGVSMSVTQRSDFSAVIQRGGGDVAVLIGHLKGKS